MNETMDKMIHQISESLIAHFSQNEILKIATLELTYPEVICGKNSKRIED